MVTDTADDAALWKEMTDQGWTGLTIPEEYGGLGLGLLELAVVSEEMGRACLTGPFLSTLFAAALIERAASPKQKAHYLEAIAAGELKATVALLEADASWDLDAVKVKATRNNGNFQVSGKKFFVPDASVSDLIVSVARNGDGHMLLPMDRGADGIELTAMPSMDMTRKLYEVAFNEAGVADSEVFGADGDARGALGQAIQIATVALSSEMVGGMQWVLDISVEYAKTRQQFGRPIGSFQAIQHQCADMLLMTESARSAVYHAAWTVSEGSPAAGTAVAIAKAYCSDAFREVCNRGVQIHGGIGFTWEHNLHLYYKRSKASEVMFGDAAFHRERIARVVIDQQ
jgi:alkylation response protein AidB-like acyl-CoA dehydrogenase